MFIYYAVLIDLYIPDAHKTLLKDLQNTNMVMFIIHQAGCLLNLLQQLLLTTSTKLLSLKNI